MWGFFSSTSKDAKATGKEPKKLTKKGNNFKSGTSKLSKEKSSSFVAENNEVIDTVEEESLPAEEEDDDMVAVVDENERLTNGLWSSKNLFPDDPMPFVCSALTSETFPDPPVAEGWRYCGDWVPELDVEGSFDGWTYAISFKSLDADNFLNCSNPKEFSMALVRRRRWIRKVEEIPKLASEELSEDLTSERSRSASVLEGVGSISGDFDVEVSSEFGDVTYSHPNSDNLSDSGSVAGGYSYSPSSSLGRSNSIYRSERSSAIAPTIGRPSLSHQNSKRQSTIGGWFASSVSDPTLVIKDYGLQSINKQIKVLEESCKKADEDFMKDFKKNRQPVLKSQITHLQSSATAIEKQMELEVHKGLKSISGLEDELKDVTEKLETLKKEFHFPNSPIILGQGGVYCALDDIWIEMASGYFVLDIIPSNREAPMIHLMLSGAGSKSASSTPTPSSSNGISVKVKLEGLKLAGDSGKGVPKLAFDSIAVTLVLQANIKLTFNTITQKWESPPKHFQVQIISFKGPYGISKGIVSTILSLATPTLRKLILSNLPQELGMWMKTLPSNFSVKGEFEFSGIEIEQLQLPLGESTLFKDLCFYSDIQLDMFAAFQKSLERSKIFRTLADLIMYRRSLIRHGPEWETIPILWDQAARIYSEKISSMMLEREPHSLPYPSISFIAIMNAADDVMRKRISADFKLTHMDGQLSLKMIMMHVHQVVLRTSIEAIEKTTSALKRARLKLFLDRIHAQYALGLDLLKLVSRNLDFAQLKTKATMKTGPSGALKVIVKDLFAQAPVLLNIKLSNQQSMGLRAIVPYMLSFKPQPNGEVIIEASHASEESVDVLEDSELLLRRDSDEIDQDDDNIGKERRFANQRRRSTKSSSAAILAHAQDESRRVQQDYNTSNAPVGTHRIQQQRQLMADTMSGVPVGNTLHKIIEIVASSPHISMIVDHAVSLKPGAELFSIVIGPKEKGWTPFGTKNMADEANEREREEAAKQGKSFAESGPDTSPGCPVLMQTALGIKMLMQVPRAEVVLNLANLIRFVLAHFMDPMALKLYLERIFHTEFPDEQLEIGKLIIEKFAKYLLVPGLEFDFNLNAKVVATGADIMITLETPGSDMESEGKTNNEQGDELVLNLSNLRKLNSASSSDPEQADFEMNTTETADESTPQRNKARKQISKSLCAVFIHAELFVMDIFEDGKAVEESFKHAFAQGET